MRHENGQIGRTGRGGILNFVSKNEARLLKNLKQVTDIISITFQNNFGYWEENGPNKRGMLMTY